MYWRSKASFGRYMNLVQRHLRAVRCPLTSTTRYEPQGVGYSSAGTAYQLELGRIPKLCVIACLNVFAKSECIVRHYWFHASESCHLQQNLRRIPLPYAAV